VDLRTRQEPPWDGSYFKSGKGNNLEGGAAWTAVWHSPLLSQFNIPRIQMWLPRRVT